MGYKRERMKNRWTRFGRFGMDWEDKEWKGCWWESGGGKQAKLRIKI